MPRRRFRRAAYYAGNHQMGATAESFSLTLAYETRPLLQQVELA